MDSDSACDGLVISLSSAKFCCFLAVKRMNSYNAKAWAYNDMC